MLTVAFESNPTSTTPALGEVGLPFPAIIIISGGSFLLVSSAAILFIVYYSRKKKATPRERIKISGGQQFVQYDMKLIQPTSMASYHNGPYSNFNVGSYSNSNIVQNHGNISPPNESLIKLASQDNTVNPVATQNITSCKLWVCDIHTPIKKLYSTAFYPGLQVVELWG